MAKKKKTKTKKTVDEKISEELSIQTKSLAPIVPVSTPVEGEVIDTDIIVRDEQPLALGYAIPGENPDINADYEAIRQQLSDVADLTAEAFEKIKEVAEQSEQPRAYEVAGQLAKVSLEAAEARMKLHKDMKSLRDQDSKNSNQRAAHIGDVNNSVFVGTTDELLKLNKAGKLPTQGDSK